MPGPKSCRRGVGDPAQAHEAQFTRCVLCVRSLVDSNHGSIAGAGAWEEEEEEEEVQARDHIFRKTREPKMPQPRLAVSLRRQFRRVYERERKERREGKKKRELTLALNAASGRVHTISGEKWRRRERKRWLSGESEKVSTRRKKRVLCRGEIINDPRQHEHHFIVPYY